MSDYKVGDVVFHKAKPDMRMVVTKANDETFTCKYWNDKNSNFAFEECIAEEFEISCPAISPTIPKRKKPIDKYSNF
jgi:hypothetical protein